MLNLLNTPSNSDKDVVKFGNVVGTVSTFFWLTSISLSLSSESDLNAIPKGISLFFGSVGDGGGRLDDILISIALGLWDRVELSSLFATLLTVKSAIVDDW